MAKGVKAVVQQLVAVLAKPIVEIVAGQIVLNLVMYFVAVIVQRVVDLRVATTVKVVVNMLVIIVVKAHVTAGKLEMNQTITFIVTQDCQLSCKYCYLVGKNNKMTMSQKTACEIVDYFLREDTFLDKHKPIVFDFIGGEPLLSIGLIKETCNYITGQLASSNYFWKENHSFRIVTNGILYGENDVQKFIEKYKDKLYVSISIDGDKNKHNASRNYINGMGSWDKIVKNLPLWIKQFPNASTKVVIAPENIEYLKNGIVYLIGIGIQHIDVNPILEEGWKDGDDESFENQLISLADYLIDNDLYENINLSCFSEHIGEKLLPTDELKWCDLSNTICVDANGIFFPCIRFAQYALRNKEAWSIGNIKDGIDKNRTRPFLTLDRITQSPKECLECDVSGGCGWCPAENYDCADTHTLFQRSTAICKMHKARVRARNYYWNKLNRTNWYNG